MNVIPICPFSYAPQLLFTAALPHPIATALQIKLIRTIKKCRHKISVP